MNPFYRGVESRIPAGDERLARELHLHVRNHALAFERTPAFGNVIRERVLERHYTGVAWYGSMLRTTQEQGGYERGLRRELTRLAAARVAERHGVNLYRDPQAASRLIGPDLLPLVDPAAGGDKPPGQSAQQPAARTVQVPIRAVAELIDRLERM